MAKEDNLKHLSSDEARLLGSKGGKASVKARRKKKELKQLLELALSQPCGDTGEDNYMGITVALVQKALNGDLYAYEVIRDTLGQKQADKVKADLSGTVTISVEIDE